jgi:hypothetical protein
VFGSKSAIRISPSAAAKLLIKAKFTMTFNNAGMSFDELSREE